MRALVLALGLVVWAGCKSTNCVVVTTQTGLGVSISENPTTQLYEARLGYFRNEFAFVPVDTNGTTPDVLMELQMNHLLKGGLIYQRLAVGKTAVSQPGATLMFSKGPDGKLSTNIAEKLKLIPVLP